MRVTVQMTREHKQKKRKSVATKQLNDNIKQMELPCTTSGCNNFLCKVAGGFQQELPFLDWHSARKLVAELLLKSLQARIKVRLAK